MCNMATAMKDAGHQVDAIGIQSHMKQPVDPATLSVSDTQLADFNKYPRIIQNMNFSGLLYHQVPNLPKLHTR